MFFFFFPSKFGLLRRTKFFSKFEERISSAVGLEDGVDGQEVLGAGLGGAPADDELGVELPAERDAPLGRHALVDQRVVVLQVGPQALGLERRPHRELQHAVRLARPDRELVRVQRELLLHRVDDVLVLEEEDLFVLMVSFRVFFSFSAFFLLFFYLFISVLAI